MEMNKIAAAILVAGLIGMVAGKVSEILYYGPDYGHHVEGHEEARGYSIDVPEGGGEAGGAEAAAPVSIIPFLAGADVAAGEKFFATKCTTCHTGEKGGADKTGPNLWGIVNRPIASHSGFKYSKAMSEHGGKWDYESLSQFLTKPKGFVPGTIMAFAGAKKDQERANLIAYLRSLSDSPAAIPAAPPPSAAAPEAAPAAAPAHE